MRPLSPLLCTVLTLPLCSVGAPATAHAFAPAPEPDDDDLDDDGDDDEAATTEAPPSPEAEKASRQIVGGVVAGSFGFILSLVAFGLLGARATCEVEGDPDCAKKMGIGALSTGIPGLALMATGGTLLGLGLKRRRALGADGKPSAALSPWLGRSGAGGTFTLRF